MKFHSLESFRGLAAIMIVLFHSPFFFSENYSTFVSNGYIFVDFFFVLSGFIMAYSYADRIGNDVTTKTFFTKRFSRIYPLHLFTLVLWIPYLLVKHILYSSGIGGTDPFIINDFFSFIENLFLVHSWGLQSHLTWNAPSWSISTEFFAYIIFYTTFYLLNKLPNKDKSILAVLFLFILTNAINFYYQDDLENFKFLMNCIASFFGGIIVYYLWLKKPQIKHLTLINICEITLIFLIYFAVTNLNKIHTQPYIITLLFMLTVFFFAIQEKGIISKLLAHKYFQLLGLLSYSIYMIHFLFIDILRGVAIFILKLPTYSITKNTEIIIFTLAPIVNLFILLLIIIVSYYTYYKFEYPMRNKINHFMDKT